MRTVTVDQLKQMTKMNTKEIALTLVAQDSLTENIEKLFVRYGGRQDSDIQQERMDNFVQVSARIRTKRTIYQTPLFQQELLQLTSHDNRSLW